MRRRPVGVNRIVTDVFSDNSASLAMLHRLGPTSVEDLGSGVSEVVVELLPLPITPLPLPLSLPMPHSPSPSGDDVPSDTRVLVPVPAGVLALPALLHHPAHRHALRTRDQTCPWFS